ncbi:MAG: hypothetical protein M1830_001016 [Pleopsidium flavum]|nr:MAG: hypothetical protein M1830_001016 [Pleopsidium flavum]
MARKPMNVVIVWEPHHEKKTCVGGSLSGLIHGIVLKRLGHNVRILERSPYPLLHDQGAGIVAMDPVQEFLRNYDLTQRPYAVTSPMLQWINMQEEVVNTMEMALKLTSWDLLYFILRANFDHVKSNYCEVPGVSEGEGKATYDYGYTATDVSYDGGLPCVYFQDQDGKEGSTAADLIVVSDGASSTIRKIIMPDLERKYVGYVAWRGTVLEDEAPTHSRDVFKENLTYFQGKGSHILLYVIPGKNGTLEPGKRLLNFVWYCNYPEDSEEFQDLMTDNQGQRHRITLPPGKMRPEVWTKQKAHAKEILPAAFADLFVKASQPFIQAITDVISPRAAFFDGQLLLVGDALAGFRPHVASSAAQAAFDAQLLAKVVKGELTMEDWEKQVLDFAQRTSQQGIAMGTKNQFQSRLQ